MVCESGDGLLGSIGDSFVKYMNGVDDGKLSSPGEEDNAKLQGTVFAGTTRVGGSSEEGSGDETLECLEGREKMREKWYKAWAEVDKAYAEYYHMGHWGRTCTEHEKNKSL